MLEKRNGMPATLLDRVSMAAVADGTAFSIQENSIFVATLSASTLSGNALVFSIAGGADAALFHIDETSGDLGFLSPPDFETPGDENRDNAYFVEIDRLEQEEFERGGGHDHTVTRFTEGAFGLASLVDAQRSVRDIRNDIVGTQGGGKLLGAGATVDKHESLHASVES